MKWLQSSRGFSLLELLITCAIIGIVCTLALPSFDFFKRWELHAQIHEIYAAMNYLRAKSMATGIEHSMIFDTTQQSYRFPGVSNTQALCKLPRSIRFDVLPGTYGPPSSPTKLVTNPITFPHQTITFFPDGIISSGTVYMCCDDQQVALTNAVSGVSYIRMYTYTNGRWHMLSS